MRIARTFGFLMVVVAVFTVGTLVGMQAHTLVTDSHFWIGVLAIVGVLGLCAVLGVLFSDH